MRLKLIKIKYIGTLLFIIASILDMTIGCIGYIFGIIISSFKGKLDEFNLEVATAEDSFGNVLCQYLFNLILIKNNGYKFGLRKETVSSVLGKNKALKSLTFIGRGIAYGLDEIQPNHVEKAVDNNV